MIYPWTHYSKKLIYTIEHPLYVGFFVSEDAEGRGIRLVVAREDNMALYWLVDETDGVIVDVRYQTLGPTALIGALEAASQILMRKNYHQTLRITADLIDRHVRDRPDTEAFPRAVGAYLNRVLSAIEKAAEQCSDIPFDEVYTASPLPPDMGESGLYPGWEQLEKPAKLAVIEEVIQKQIRPYIELDAGGIQIISLSDEHELLIAYEGSCTSCYSATGSTLSAIQQILQTHVHPAIRVVPDLSLLQKS